MDSAAPSEKKRRMLRHPHALPLLAAGAALILSACTPAPDVAAGSGAATMAAPSAEGAEGTVQTDTPAPSEPESPDADTAAIAAAVEGALRSLAASRPAVTSDEVRAAIDQGFVEAGSAPESLEVSIDRTPTGLDVDAIQGAGRTGETCIVGEVRAGTVAVAVLPVLATGMCFVGDQR